MDQDLHQFWDQRSPEGVGVGLGVGSSVISTVKELKRSFKDVLQGLNSIRKLFISFTSCSIMTWFLRGLVWERVWKLMTFLVWNRVRIWRTGWHNVTHKQMQRVPPPPRETVMMPFFKGGRPLTSLFVLALTAMCHLPGPSSFQSQCSVLNRWLWIEPRTGNICEQIL